MNKELLWSWCCQSWPRGTEGRTG